MVHRQFHTIDDHTNVKRTIWLTAGDFPVRSGVTLTNMGEGPELKFPDTGINHIHGGFIVPSDYAGASLKFTIYWLAASTSGSVYWKIYLDWCKEGEYVTNELMDSGSSMIDTAYSTQYHVKAVSWTASGDFEVGDLVGIGIDRMGSEATDDMSGDALLYIVKVEYTAEQ